MDSWTKTFAFFFSNRFAMNDFTLYLLRFVNPIVIATTLPRPQIGIFRLNEI
jgi:hypothetical protein